MLLGIRFAIIPKRMTLFTENKIGNHLRQAAQHRDFLTNLGKENLKYMLCDPFITKLT